MSEMERGLFERMGIPPKKPAETYPDEGPPPRSSIINVTIQPKTSVNNLHQKEYLHQKISSNCDFDTDVDQDEEGE
jgi:hypothetical protein